MFDDSEVDVINEPLEDDYMNVIEVVCAIRDTPDDQED